MTADRLGHRYRRALWGYPPGPRRAELLDTLLAAAPEGRRWPTARERANLLRHGLRARLGRPGSRAVVALAVLVSLFAGFLAASAAHAIALTASPDLPRGAARAEIQESLFPGLVPWADQDGDVLTDLGGLGDDLSYATVTLAPEQRFVTGDYADWTEQTVTRLVAAGWVVGQVSPVGSTDDASGDVVPDGTFVQARRGDLTLELNTTTATVDRPAGAFDVNAVIRRFLPPSAAWIALAAGLPAVLLGWLIFGWGSRRTEGADGVVRFLTREPVVVAAVIMSPLIVGGLAGLGSEFLRLGVPREPFWALTVTWGYDYTLVALGLYALALTVAARGQRRAAATRAEIRSAGTGATK